MDKPSASRAVRHVVQNQQFPIDMSIRVTQNPQNKLLRKKDKVPYEVHVSMKINDKGYTTTERVKEDETFTDALNIISKTVAYKLIDSLFPSEKAKYINVKRTDEDQV